MKKHWNECASAFQSAARRAGVVAVSLLAVPATTLALDYTSTAGGGGGTSFTASCGSDQALVGIKGYAGSFIDGLQGVCVQVSHDGSWVGSTVTTSFAGKSSGTSFSLICPTGHAVSGIKGRAGSYIDQLRVRCGRLGPNGMLASYGDYLSGTAGGGGGNAFGPFDCSSSQPARLLRGKAGSWIDSLGLGCAAVNTLRLSDLTISPVPVRWSSTPGASRATAKVQMSLLPKADVAVNLTSSDPTVAAFTGGRATASPTIRTYGDGSVSLTLDPLKFGCSSITAAYQGASLTRDLLVYQDDDWELDFEAPATAIVGQPFDVSVRRLDPGGTTAGWTISLQNYDNIAMSVPGLATGTLNIPAGQAGNVTVPAGSDGARFQLIVAAAGCVRIKVIVGEYRVIRPVRVRLQPLPIGTITR
ncbi:MAG: hypothetical protein FJ191_10960 [Gammaproteobacteria bacterium]|nr:hypothetical protein [Gammaproteobacteria bacterium]